MQLLLPERDTTSTELMDQPDCSPRKLENTYRQFRTINRFLSGWDLLFHTHIAPRCTDPKRTYYLLDIGFGGGDVPARLDALAREYDIDLHITAIDTDARAVAYARENIRLANVHFRHASEQELINENRIFDFIISNHLVHHLDEKQLVRLLENTELLNDGLLLFNDLRRSPISWLLFNALTLFAFRKSFIRYDGLLSIRRSYRPDELRDKLPEGFEVESFPPFRMIIKREKVRDAEEG